MGKSKDGSEMLFSSELKGIVDQCHVEDLILVPAGHYWTRESGLVDYYKPEWDTDGYTDQFEEPQLKQNYTNGHTNGHTNGNIVDHTIINSVYSPKLKVMFLSASHFLRP